MFEIRHNSELHKKVYEALDARVKLAEQGMNTLQAAWDKVEKMCAFYVKESELDGVRRTQRDAGVPQYTTVEIPYVYAQTLAAHTYITSVLLGRRPIWEVQGSHGEAENSVFAVETLLDYQVRMAAMEPVYYVWLWDALKYGIGIICEYWKEESYNVSHFEEVPVRVDGIAIPDKFETQRVIETVEGYKGNTIFNVRPYDLIGDPRVPLSQVDKAEFIGRKIEMLWPEFVQGVAAGRYFNKEAAKKVFRGANYRERHEATGINLPKVDYSGTNEAAMLHPARGYEMEVNLIPSMWGLGSSSLPEKWCFTVLDKIIVEAVPLNRRHNRFSYSIIETEVEGYNFVKRGMLEVGTSLNQVLNWLVNSHFYSVRKTLNGDIVYDPTMVSQTDVLDPQPGRRIKLKPEAYGRDVRSAIHNLTLGGDVTQSHLADTNYVGMMLQRLLGVSDTTVGVPQQGGRRTATESRIASAGSVGRMKTVAEYMGAMGVRPHVQKLIMNTQQLYSEERIFRIAGDSLLNGQQVMRIKREDLQGGFEYVPVDGNLPLDRYAVVAMWGNLFAQVKNLPQVMAAYDMGRIFEWVAQQGGIRNIRQFKVQVGEGGPGFIGMDGGVGGPQGRAAPKSTLGAGSAIPFPLSAPGMDRSA